MFEAKSSFLDLALEGKVTLESIDDYVGRWHESTTSMALHDFLGMTRDEYGMWVRFPDALPRILEGRKQGTSLHQSVREL